MLVQSFKRQKLRPQSYIYLQQRITLLIQIILCIMRLLMRIKLCHVGVCRVGKFPQYKEFINYSLPERRKPLATILPFFNNSPSSGYSLPTKPGKTDDLCSISWRTTNWGSDRSWEWERSTFEDTTKKNSSMSISFSNEVISYGDKI